MLQDFTQDAHAASLTLASRPWRVGIEAAADGYHDFAHTRIRQHASLLGESRALGKYLHEVSFDEGWPGQSGFAGRKLDDGRAFGAAAAEGNDQHRFGAGAEISLIQRDDQHPVANRRIA